ncbi:MAG: cytochrome c [Polyangiales bacterium]
MRHQWFSGSTTGKNLESYAGPIDSMDAATGKVVWDTYCDGCHPGGDKGKGPSVIDIELSAPSMRKQIREGGKKMPDFDESKIDAPSLEALLAYLQTMNAVK